MISTLFAQAKLNNPLVPKLSPSSPDQAVSSLSSLIQTVIGWLFTAGLLLFIIFFLLSALKWIASSGDKQQIENARQGISHAIVGLLALFALFAILKTIEIVFGVCALQIPIPVLGELNSHRCGAANMCTGNQSCAQ